MAVRRTLLATCACLLATACGQTADKTPAAAPTASGAAAQAAPPAVGTPVVPTKELMGHVMQFAAEGIWSRQGWSSDAAGEHSLFPANKEEWEQAESAALTLAELTNTLLVSGRRVDDPRWDQSVAAVRATAVRAAKAAESQNADAWFAAGTELDSACEGCHLNFAPWGKQNQQAKR